MRTRTAALSGAAAACALAGCSTPFEEPDVFGVTAGVVAGTNCDDPTPRIEIGTGDLAYEPIDDGDEVVIIHGSQGGWHIEGSIRTAHFDQYVRIAYTLEDVDSGVIVADSSFQVALVPEEDCVMRYVGMNGIFDPDLYGVLVEEDGDTPCDLFGGQALRMSMEVSAGETSAAATKDIVAVADANCESSS